VTTLDHLEAGDVRKVIAAYRDALRSHREVINRLNVYPVPDGDTGTNMALTLESVAAELDDADEDLASVCKAVSHGSLMGARGNSGVILSQILRGIAGVLAEDGAGDGRCVAKALAAASDAAYHAVMRPVEGTILTVVRHSAEASRHAAGEGDAGGASASLVEVLDAARAAGAEALARTPELLPVLADAGVVDAGGSGYLLLLDAMLHVADGRPLPEPPELPTLDGAATAGHATEPMPGHGEGDVSDLRYEIMYFLEAPDEAIDAFKDVWAGIGDSIVVVGGDGLWNCHIHADDIGAAIEAALDCGRPRNIRVTDLLEQVEEERWVREAEVGAEDESPTLATPVATAVVAVSTGAGIRRIFHSLGVQAVVTGGQSMNPSTAQLLDAVERCPSDTVVLLPNNKNIIPVAEQVDAQTTKTVRVVPTRSITEGFAALMCYDPEAGGDENAKAMSAGAANVTAGEVTRAVRDSSWELGPIAEGDWLGLSRKGIEAVESTLADAATRLLERLMDANHEIVTLIEGEGSSVADTRRITQWVAEAYPEATVEVHQGGQPLYPYLVGLE
jgi:DAK2 domain fusion protein YloV